MAEEYIRIRGAREHNLKNIDLDIPREKLVVITGLSGSGKSSLAFDTIFAEGQRRYVESLSAYARQFLGMLEKPDVDHIDGLSPAISIDQKGASRNPRSTVGTVTEVYDYLRLLFARIGVPHCPECGREISQQTVQQMVDTLLDLPDGTRYMILAPIVQDRKGEYRQVFEDARQAGYVRVRVDGTVYDLDETPALDRYKQHTIEIVVDRLVNRGGETDKTRVADSLETALRLGSSVVRVVIVDGADHHAPAIEKPSAARHSGESRNPSDLQSGLHGSDGERADGDGRSELVELLFSEQFACVHCGISLGEVEPRTFSFNSPHGACPDCTGIGTTMVFDPDLIVPNKRLSPLEGAILPWSRLASKDSYLYQVVKAVAAHYGFSLRAPVAELASEHVDIMLYGTEERIPVSVKAARDETRTFTVDFEGVIPNLQRRYKETDSDYMRQEIERFMTVQPCPSCQGARLKPESLSVTINAHTIAQVTAFAVKDARAWFEALPLTERERLIGRQILKEIQARLHFLENVGLDYLTLDRATATLSGGEAQRIRLATQIGSGLVGVLYILDEPSIGLHQRDNRRLIATLNGLRDLGNTVLVVEHDEETIRSADHVIDIGPGAGEHGGRIVAAGPLEDVMAVDESLTADYLTGRRVIPVPQERRHPSTGSGRTVVTSSGRTVERGSGGTGAKGSGRTAVGGSGQTAAAGAGPAGRARITVKGARANNLKSIDVDFPLGRLIGVTGVSGSGKSSLVIDVLYRRLAQEIYNSRERPGPHDAILGLENIDKVIDINQQPIGRTPRSNPATYTGAFTPIREIFAKTPEARVRGYKPGRFSFNVKGGRCEACRGDGIIKIEMQFLPDVYVPCEVCEGKRYNREALEVTYKGKTIADVLDLTIEEANAFFENIPSIHNKLRTLVDVGLGYMRVGQPATTLSGGEAQRIKLAAELSKRATGRTLYILDEPTTGLHFADVERLLEVLQRLVDTGNTVIVIEHNLEVIKCVDWVIDLGPEGGDAGGEMVAEGTPETLAHLPHSYTGVYLRTVLERDGALEKAHAS